MGAEQVRRGGAHAPAGASDRAATASGRRGGGGRGRGYRSTSAAEKVSRRRRMRGEGGRCATRPRERAHCFSTRRGRGARDLRRGPRRVACAVANGGRRRVARSRQSVRRRSHPSMARRSSTPFSTTPCSSGRGGSRARRAAAATCGYPDTPPRPRRSRASSPTSAATRARRRVRRCQPRAAAATRRPLKHFRAACGAVAMMRAELGSSRFNLATSGFAPARRLVVAPLGVPHRPLQLAHRRLLARRGIPAPRTSAG